MHALPLFDFEAFVVAKGKDRLMTVLEALPAEKLIITLEKERWTGRRIFRAGDVAAFIAGILHDCHSVAMLPDS